MRGVIGGIRRSTCVLSSSTARRSLVAALALSGCGTKGGDTASGGSTSGTKCDLQIGFFGALTGDAANLGINIKNGADLAVEAVQQEAHGLPGQAQAVRLPG